MKVNLNKVSHRARGFFENPQFLKSDLLEDFTVTLDKSDKILTVFSKKNSGEIELIFAEGLAIFSRNRSQRELWKINFREFENFLRDENHLPAFGEELPELEEILNKMKISLIASVIKATIKFDLTQYSATVSHWRNINLVAKNIWARDFLAIFGWELIFCDDETLTVTKVPPEATNESLEFLFQKILGTGESILPMKVVAVQ